MRLRNSTTASRVVGDAIRAAAVRNSLHLKRLGADDSFLLRRSTTLKRADDSFLLRDSTRDEPFLTS